MPRPTYYLRPDGTVVTKESLEDIEGMSSPVRCLRCGKVYDVGTVTVTERYADCSVWKSPCCHRVVDDRQFKSLPDIEPIRPGRQPFD